MEVGALVERDVEFGCPALGPKAFMVSLAECVALYQPGTNHHNSPFRHGIAGHLGISQCPAPFQDPGRWDEPHRFFDDTLCVNQAAQLTNAGRAITQGGRSNLRMLIEIGFYRRQAQRRIDLVGRMPTLMLDIPYQHQVQGLAQVGAVYAGSGRLPERPRDRQHVGLEVGTACQGAARCLQ